MPTCGPRWRRGREAPSDASWTACRGGAAGGGASPSSAIGPASLSWGEAAVAFAWALLAMTLLVYWLRAAADLCLDTVPGSRSSGGYSLVAMVAAALCAWSTTTLVQLRVVGSTR